MESATTVWAGVLSPFRSRRRRADRHRTRRAVRRFITVLTKVTLGLMLVGCSTIPGLNLASRSRDPIAAIQSGLAGNERIAAYRELGNTANLSPETRQAAQRLLIDGATQEYNVVARAAAVSSLAAYDGDEVLDILLKAAKDRNPIVRVEACRALKNRRTPAVDAALNELATKDGDPDVRMAATGSLVATADPASVHVLLECLKDEELAVSRRAAEGLRSLTGASIQSEDYAKWQEWVDAHPGFDDIPRTAEKPQRAGFFELFRR